MSCAYNKLEQLLLLVKCPTEIEIQLQNTPVKRAPKSPPMPIFPWMPHDPERNIFIWRTCGEDD